MVSQNHPHRYDSWAGEFPSDVPSNLNEDRHPHNASNASPAPPHAGPTFNDNFANQRASNISGVDTTPSSLDDYELHFGPHSPVAPVAPSPPSPPPLAFDEIINILAFSPNEAPGPSLLMQDSAGRTSNQSAPTPVQGPAPVHIPTFPQARDAPFGGPPMSVSLPYRVHSTQGLMYPGSYGLFNA
ncbi:hypothetical protein FRC00_001450 [Tulasnella sp. 408]|nr:hypothetical protein FRC00_001450 [Tulasnella sp. 408]